MTALLKKHLENSPVRLFATFYPLWHSRGGVTSPPPGGREINAPKGRRVTSLAFCLLIAIFAGGHWGRLTRRRIACFITMVSYSALPRSGLRLANLDLSRVRAPGGGIWCVKRGDSCQQRHRRSLRRANDELDERVKSRTQDSAQAVQALESKLRNTRRPRQDLQTQWSALITARSNYASHWREAGFAQRFQVVIRTLEDNLPIDFGCVCLYNPSRQT